MITRLLHIPKILLSKPATTDPKLLAFARTALLRAIPHIKKTWDYNLYLRSIAQINETLGRPSQVNRPTSDDDGAADEDEDEEDEPMADSIGDLAGTGNEAEGVPDRAWVEAVKEEEKREVTKTDVELRGYMSNLIKESIRVSPFPQSFRPPSARGADHLCSSPTCHSHVWLSRAANLARSSSTMQQRGNLPVVHFITWNKVSVSLR